MNHPDLNDLQFYAMVVEHGGFAAASRAACASASIVCAWR